MGLIRNEDFSPALRRIMEGKGQSEPSTRRCVQEIDNGEALCYEPLDDKGRCHIHGAQWTYIGGRE